MTSSPNGAEGSFSARAATACRAAAMVALLACAGARVLVSEMPYRGSLLNPSIGAMDPVGALPAGAGREELSRVTFAVLLAAIGALWLFGCALSGRLTGRHPWLAGMVAGFVLWSLLTALRSADKRSALDMWVEQVSLMSACLLSVQLLGDRKRFTVFVAVLAGIGGLLAVKGLWQVAVEIPERVADFAANREARLGELGLLPGSAEALAFEARLGATTPTGFFVMSNLYAAVLTIALPAAVGLAADKTLLAVATWRQGGRRHKGHLHLPWIAAALTWMIAIVCGAALILSRSRGGILAATMALLATAAIARWRQALAGHWRKAVVAAAAVFLLGVGAVVAYGLARDRLPTKTMTFRWYYWTGGAKIVAAHPWFGVGPGNFASAYLQVRRPAAEEAVKDPHNIIVHAASQYGLPGGAMYLAIVAYVLVAAARPRRADAPQPPAYHPPKPALKAATIITAIAAAALATRSLVTGSTGSVAYFIIDTAIPVAALVAMLAMTLWVGWPPQARPASPMALPNTEAGGGESLEPKFSRIALACGAAGFVLHGMVEFAPWAPGAALVFWTSAGACLAQARPAKEWNLSPLRWLKVLSASAAVAAAGMALWHPVFKRIVLTERAAAELRLEERWIAVHRAEEAAAADGMDAWSAADAAKTILAASPRQRPGDFLRQAQTWAREACRRDPSYYGHQRLLAYLYSMTFAPDAFRYSWPGLGDKMTVSQEACLRSAEAGDPAAMCDLAWLLRDKGAYPQALRWLRSAIALDPHSPTLHAHLGETYWAAGDTGEAARAWRQSAQLATPNPAALKSMSRSAVELNPMDARLRLEYAQMLVFHGEARACLEQLAAAEDIDKALYPESLLHFNTAERRHIAMLRAWAEAIPNHGVTPWAAPDNRPMGQ